ncbi:MAG: DUF1501 domain-containing protein [Planctomycetes bacterium]|nr:DUF1501 domain-containing protein [Planctomycetota bacterium]
MPAAISRRELFRMGGLSVGAISPIGLSLSEVLANEASSGGSKQINVIFMFLQGGASHIDMYDMKPRMTGEIRGKYDPVATSLPGLQLSDQLPKLGQCAEKFSLIRSMHSYTSKHGEGDVHIMCGSELDKNLQAPGIGSVLSLQQKQQALIPPFVHMGNMKHPAYSAPGFGGYLGRTYNPFLIDQDPNSPSFRVQAFDAARDVDVGRLSGRKTLVRSLDSFQAKQEQQRQLARSHDTVTELTLSLTTSQRAMQSIDLPQMTAQHS